MNEALGYDKTNPSSIESYAKGLVGKTFGEVCMMDSVHESSDYAVAHEDRNRKGGLGELIEERFFHYKANGDSRPDFYEAGVELKVTPYKVNSNGSKSAKERLVINMIDYNTVVEEEFEESHVYEKSKLMLLVYYLYDKNISNRLDYRMDYVKLFSPTEADIEIIKNDFNTIVNKIKEGKAHELSESDTLYLSAAPKAANSQVRRSQPFSDIPAKPRAFALKSSYMTYVLNEYMIPDKHTYRCESILRGRNSKSHLEEYVIQVISKYKGKSVDELIDLLDPTLNKKAKSFAANLTYRMLGIHGNKAEEFEKANVVIKTIRVEEKGTIKENMSFPNFKFKELIKEEWEESTFGGYLQRTKFLFIVYRFNEEGELILQGAKFWNMPYDDLEEVRRVWEQTIDVLKTGVEIRTSGKKNFNNLPKQSQSPICHVRPHAQNADDVDQLPDGRWLPKQCFWLNNSYILEQISDLI